MAFVKLHTDIIGDAKLLRAARKGSTALLWLPWLLVFAKSSEDNGRLTVNREPAEPDDIAPLIPGATKKQIAQCMRELEDIGILVRDGDVLRFKRWDARAGKDSDTRDATRNRKRLQRERESREREHAESRVTERDMSRDLSRDGHAVEKEKEKEKEKEQEEMRVTSAFADAWSHYPKRGGTNSRHDAEKAWVARAREGVDPTAMLDGTRRYRAYCDAQSQTGTQFVMQASRFYGAAKHYEEPWAAVDEMPQMYAANGVDYSPEWMAWSARTAPNGKVPR